MTADRRTPVTFLVGTLGAGKTTLLKQLLANPALTQTALLVNEFGDVPIDYDLLREVKDDTLLLPGGCACCVAHGDFVRVLLDLYAQAARGAGPRFQRVIIETSGAADPTTMLAALSRHPTLAQAYALLAVVAVVDARAGFDASVRSPYGRRQLALADVVYLSKQDLVSTEAPAAALREALACLNPTAELATVGELVTHLTAPSAPHARTLPAPLVPTLAGGTMRSHTLQFAGTISPSGLVMWLSVMTSLHGERLLRVKGVVWLRVDEGAPPVATLVQTVGHMLYPLAEYPQTAPVELGDNRLVFIAAGMSQTELRELAQGLQEVAQCSIAPPPSH